MASWSTSSASSLLPVAISAIRKARRSTDLRNCSMDPVLPPGIGFLSSLDHTRPYLPEPLFFLVLEPAPRLTSDFPAIQNFAGGWDLAQPPHLALLAGAGWPLSRFAYLLTHLFPWLRTSRHRLALSRCMSLRSPRRSRTSRCRSRRSARRSHRSFLKSRRSLFRLSRSVVAAA